MKIPALSKKSDFKNLSSHGKKVYTSFYTIVYCRNDNLNLRMSFAASKRLGNAVIRNKIRRRLRSAIAQSMEGSTCNVDMLIIPKPKSLDYNFQELVQDMKKIIEKIG